MGRKSRFLKNPERFITKFGKKLSVFLPSISAVREKLVTTEVTEEATEEEPIQIVEVQEEKPEKKASPKTRPKQTQKKIQTTRKRRTTKTKSSS